jgi:hypothetical protein
MAVVELGAGNAVSTVRGLSKQVARSHNATLVRINPRDYQVPRDRDISLPLIAAEAVNAIVECMYAIPRFPWHTRHIMLL